MRHALSHTFFHHSPSADGGITQWLRELVRGWRQDYAFARRMQDELSGMPLTRSNIARARHKVQSALRNVRPSLFHLDDLPVPQRDPPVHPSRKVVIVRRDKGGKLRRADDLR